VSYSHHPRARWSVAKWWRFWAPKHTDREIETQRNAVDDFRRQIEESRDVKSKPTRKRRTGAG
jgi:hypothetical protein